MNREILFRGKRKSNEHWIYGYVNADNRGITIKFIENNFYKEIPVIPETVGQYTGLTDKNGKKIFEGDIVKYNNTIYKIAYITRYARFGGIKPKVIMSIFPLEDSKVIGNIHDNPELLEVSG